MPEPSQTETLLIERVRHGDSDAWSDLIVRFEGRLLAFAETRLKDRSVAEDIVQETFVGFLRSLPNYDGRRSLESYLFSICAHKLTDHLRREGRRPTLQMPASDSGSPDWQIPGSDRVASSIARSVERRGLEEEAVVQALQTQVDQWRKKGEWTKLKCIELLFLCGWANKHVATELGLSEQQVANYKFDFVARLRATIRRQGLSSDVFPELDDS